jgi:hypothetical protein
LARQSNDTFGAIQHLEFKARILQVLQQKAVDILILEGYMLYFDLAVFVLCDHKYLLNVPKDVARERRWNSQQFPRDLYDTQVWPNHLRYLERVELNRVCCNGMVKVLDGQKSVPQNTEAIWKGLGTSK